MKVLWAPWRMDYILSNDKGEGCIFCPGDDRGQDEERLILYAGSLSMVMMNRYEENLDLMLMVRRSINILKKTMNPEGFNVGLNLGQVAGAGVKEHMHFHIVPRWNGDTNYMTVLGDVRVIPEHIMETYSKLLPYFKES